MQGEDYTPRLLPSGEQALTFQISEAVDEGANRRIIALAAALDRAIAAGEIAGVTERVPTYRSLLVRYDPERIRGAALGEALLALHAGLEARAETGRLWRVPVHYGGPAALDLESLAAEKGMTPDELVALHSGAEYRVYMIGFAPGFAYLGGLPGILHAPRLPQPRQLVPAGAIGIGGKQGNINSVAGPSGWRFLGATPVRLFDPRRADPFLLEAGDRVRFEPVDAAAFARLSAEAEAGSALIAPEEAA
ncbi:5-oxoprolinase subunit PxpB [Poseidonocella sp. HB161398]|uniref:5-oxoprolinase subunit PxpB n=1 Tax=Poseidonocella sp. HB161398 TaxID=2320855 RepID=UPI00110892E9|nr:5-oxoprolinase subunit PxpB [Poseidonocella sp. HB161398]